jgi:O-antigen/teichoic acid export membrane protein
VIAPFLSVSFGGSLLLAPLAPLMVRDGVEHGEGLSTLLKAALIIAVVAGILGFGLMLAAHASISLAIVLTPYIMLCVFRWFGRGYVLARSRPAAAMISDLAYSIWLSACLAVMLFKGRTDMMSVAEMMVTASIVGTLALGSDFLSKQFFQLGRGSLFAFGPIWREFSRWSLLGVTTAELTANAHAYLVTFFAGPRAFAVLAVGALLMRPVSLVLGALPDLERPRMTRALTSGDTRQAFRYLNQFRTAGGAVWVVTLGFAAVLLLWFPELILKNKYDLDEVLAVIAIWAVIMACRVFRTPESILLQSAGEYRTLASVSSKSGIVSVVATVVLLLAFGSLAALGGILTGEIVMTFTTIALYRRWKASNV